MSVYPNSPQLVAALSQGLIEVAFLRQEDGGPGLEYLLLSEANDSPVLKLFLSRIKEHAMYRGTLPPSNGKHVTGEQ
jgi:hypothetical protein